MFAMLMLLAEEKAAPEGPAWYFQFLPLVVIFALFYFLLIMPAQRRERKHRENVLNNLKKGDKVVTNAGILGVVANVKDDEVTLKLEEGKLRVLKSTISRILGAEDAAKDQKQEVSKNT